MILWFEGNGGDILSQELWRLMLFRERSEGTRGAVDGRIAHREDGEHNYCVEN